MLSFCDNLKIKQRKKTRNIFSPIRLGKIKWKNEPRAWCDYGKMRAPSGGSVMAQPF